MNFPKLGILNALSLTATTVLIVGMVHAARAQQVFPRRPPASQATR
jgi:hypothetical protein